MQPALPEGDSRARLRSNGSPGSGASGKSVLGQRVPRTTNGWGGAEAAVRWCLVGSGRGGAGRGGAGPGCGGGLMVLARGASGRPRAGGSCGRSWRVGAELARWGGAEMAGAGEAQVVAWSPCRRGELACRVAVSGRFAWGADGWDRRTGGICICRCTEVQETPARRGNTRDGGPGTGEPWGRGQPAGTFGAITAHDERPDSERGVGPFARVLQVRCPAGHIAVLLSAWPSGAAVLRPRGDRRVEVSGAQAAWRTNCTSRLMVTSLPSVKPPASRAAFQLTPNSVRSIFVVASAPSLTWP